jgi:hypothetical protein
MFQLLYIEHMCHVFIGHSSRMFHVLGLFWNTDVFCFLSCIMVGKHLR